MRTNSITGAFCAFSTLAALAGVASATVTETASAKADFVISGYVIGTKTHDKVPAGLDITFNGSDSTTIDPDTDPNKSGTGKSEGSASASQLAGGFNKDGGFTVAAYTQSVASPAGWARASQSAWGEVTMVNNSGVDIIVKYKMPFRWLSSSIGNHPQLEKGTADPKIITTAGDNPGKITQYPKGQTLADQGSPERNVTIKNGHTGTYRITCTANTEAEAKLPAPGAVTLAGVGVLTIAQRRRR
ncbi:MAG: hypothetical protein L6Q35_00060 [Phycisphaerales bacterium]|nr:hypothetical protein [Phycisphaerales bacterium]